MVVSSLVHLGGMVAYESVSYLSSVISHQINSRNYPQDIQKELDDLDLPATLDLVTSLDRDKQNSKFLSQSQNTAFQNLHQSLTRLKKKIDKLHVEMDKYHNRPWYKYFQTFDSGNLMTEIRSEFKLLTHRLKLYFKVSSSSL